MKNAASNSHPREADGEEEEDELGGGRPHPRLEDQAGEEAAHQVPQEPEGPHKVHRVNGDSGVPAKMALVKEDNVAVRTGNFLKSNLDQIKYWVPKNCS